MKIDISEITEVFPETRIAAVVAERCTIPSERPEALDALIAEREGNCRQVWGDTPLSEIPGIAAWRRIYRAFGIKKTSYRSSVERLVKNVLADRQLPPINGFVDSYNAVSLAHVLPAGADDLDKVAGDIAFRFSRTGDSFVDMAAGDGGAEDPPKSGEVVYADEEKVLCRRWNWRQDARSIVTPETRSAVVTVQANGAGDLEAAVADLQVLLTQFSSASCAVTIVDAERPRADLALP